MKEYRVDLSGAETIEGVHRMIAQELKLPSWYGGNLDALYDALTELETPALIRVIGLDRVHEQLQAYSGRLRAVLKDAESETPDLTVRFETEDSAAGSGNGGEMAPEAQVEEKRILIITDLHGCYDECRLLLEKMDFDEKADILINLGDTIDRGPKIFETFEYLYGLKERMGERCILIRGNHEQMMLDAAARGGRDKELWYYNSGEKTVYAFLHHKHKFQEFLAWYEKMPYYYTAEKFSCVHAALKDPDPALNAVDTLIWGRDTDYSGKLVMTGHTPYRAPLYFLGGNYGKIQEDVWTWLPENGMIALDTGCVYGNRLTGMIIRPDGSFLVTSVKSGSIKK